MTDLIERLYSMQGMGDVQLKALMDGVGPKGADEIKHLRAELMEQCRLLGMSAEREAKHLAQIAALEKERDALRAELDALNAWKEEVEKQEPVAEVVWMAGLPNSMLEIQTYGSLTPPLGTKFYARPVPAGVPDGVMRERVMEAIAEALGDGAYDCTRVWSAWGYGTMGSDDFRLIANDPARLHEIAEAAIQAVFAAAPKPEVK